MKTTKMIAAILAVFLVAVLFMGAASAEPGIGDTVYVYQEDGSGDNAAVTYYRTDGTVTKPILGSVKTNADGTFYGEGIIEGIYYSSIGAGNLFTLKYPTFTLAGYLDNGAGVPTSTSIAGRTLSTSEDVDFIITGDNSINYAIKFTTPAGGSTTTFGEDATLPAGTAMSFADSTAATFRLTQISLNGVTSGTWSAVAEFKTGISTPAVPKMASTTPSKYLVTDKLTFTVGSTVSDTIAISTEKAIRGGSTLITITGTPSSYVKVTVNEAGLILRPGQSGVLYVAPVPAWTTVPTYSGAYVRDFWVQLSNTGTRTVELDSNSNSPDKAYTIKAEFSTSRTSTGGAIGAGHTDKSVKFTLEKGAVTASAAQDSYYLGNDITLSGTNTESSKVFIFIKGSNVPTSYLLTADVKSDDTWTTTFDPKTAYNNAYGDTLDAGTYTFYASSDVTVVGGVNTFNSDFAYASVSVALKQPFLSGAPESTTVAKGDKIKITGTAEATNNLRYYVFGTNKFVSGTVSVADDATYTAEIETTNLAAGQYFVVIQHPMYDTFFNIGPADNLFAYANGAFWNWGTTSAMIVLDTTADVPSQFVYSVGDSKVSGVATTGYVGNPLTAAAGLTTTIVNPAPLGSSYSVLFDTKDRQSANAAEALCQALDSQNIDDIYLKLTFIVAQPTLTLNPVSDVTKGSALKVSGTTNVKAGETVTVDVLSTAFTAIDKTSVNSASFITLSTKVVKGTDGVNTWEVTFDTTGLNVDTYTIQAAIDELTTSTVIKVIEKPTATATATATKTATATATATATPTKTPGFGAFLALAGLGAVAVLVLRRD